MTFAPTPIAHLDRALAASLRAMNAKWTITGDNVLHLALPPEQNVRKAVALVTSFYGRAAVICLPKHGAEIQLS